MKILLISFESISKIGEKVKGWIVGTQFLPRCM